MIRTFFRFVLLFIVIVVLAASVFYFSPPLRQHIPYYASIRTYAILLFRNPFCSFSQALKGISLWDCAQAQNKILSQSCRILKIDEKGFVLWDTGKETLWAPPGSEFKPAYLGTYMVPALLAEQECNIYGAEKQGVRPGDIVLDCGAHIGLYTKKALAAGAKLVVAIEPSPENIECLHRNFSKDIDAGRVIVYPKGVWNRKDELSFKMERSLSGGNHIAQESEGGDQIIHIPVTTIDNIVSELKLEKVDFIKMDIEGAEQNALTGAQQTIVTHHPRMAIATEHTDNWTENAQRVSTIILDISDYCIECGQVLITGTPGYVQPMVVYFY